jgi:hypothetical protein
MPISLVTQNNGLFEELYLRSKAKQGIKNSE